MIPWPVFGKTLYPDVIGALASFEASRPHPYGFYRKLGYVLVGALPDATGPGRHDILMAKRL